MSVLENLDTIHPYRAPYDKRKQETAFLFHDSIFFLPLSKNALCAKADGKSRINRTH